MRRFARSCFWLLAFLGVALARGPVAVNVAAGRLTFGPDLRAAGDRDKEDDKSRNRAPSVSAGPNQTVVLPASAFLAGSVTDECDGRDGDRRGGNRDNDDHDKPHLVVQWSKVSGPGTVTFASRTSPKTSASFSAAGTYILRLTATDGALSASDDVAITVKPAVPVNKAPVVNAGVDQTITLPATAALKGTVTDDGLPAGATVTTTWSKVSGPGTVTFANASSLTTTAAFGVAGTYCLKLTASDTKLSASSDVTVTVKAGAINKAPVVNAGVDQSIALPAAAALKGTVTDDGLPAGATVTTNWSKVSGPGTVTFASASGLTTAATFGQAGTYVLRLTASDSVLSAFDELAVIVKPAPPTNLPPTVNAGANATITLPSSAALNGVVTDDGLPSGSTVTTVWTKFSGPGAVTFANATSAVTTATFGQAGTYVLRLTASDSLLSASSDVTITVNPAIVTPPTNLPPTVNAGTNATITLPAGAALSGVVSDDGLPTGATVTSAWTKFSGPGAVTFANATSAVTTATFDQAGTYVVRLTASDSLLSASSDVTITVNPPIVTPPTNQPPTVNAGMNATITLPSSAALSGVVTDDGLPSGATVTSAWTKFSGPGAVTFANATSAVTTATFGQAGTYVLRLTASDSLLSASSDVTITVNPPIVTPPTNQPPTVTAGANATIILPAGAALSGVVTDDGLPTGATVTSAWTKFSGPGAVTFANAASAVTTATFDQAGTYVLRLTASDSLLSASSDVTITVNPPIVTPPTNQPPTVNAGTNATITLPAGAALNGVVTDDGLPSGSTVTTVWTKFSGPGAVTFANATSAVTTAVFDQAGTYVLRLTASDSLLSASSDVTITVNPPIVTPPTNQPPTVNAGTNATITLPAGAALSGVVTDDGLPSGSTVTTVWTKFSGPGGVSFANAASAVTTATFDQAGTYVLRLTASDTLLSAFSDVTITVTNPVPTNHAPVARAGGPYSGATGVAIGFNGSLSSDPDADPLTFAWSFGDGTTATGPQPSHAFATADQFTVTLTVSDGKGGSNSATVLASVAQTNRAPTASAGGPYAGDAGSPIGFVAIASDPDQDALTLSWNYGDGSQGSGPAPSHIYAAQGTYAVTLSVSDGHGGTATAVASAVVGVAADRAPPIVKLSAATTALPGTETIVTADATDNVGIAGVSFDVEGAPSSQVAVSPYRRTVSIPALAAPGTTIKVTATAHDAANNTGSDRATITIVAAPDTAPPTVAIQLPPQASPGSTIVISASATDAGGVQLVSFSNAGVTFATDSASPYSVLFVVPPDTAPGATLSFAARASDFSNNVADSSGQVPIVAAADTQPPTVALSAPASVVQGGTLHLTAAAADNVQVGSVDFLLDDVLAGSAIAPPFTADVTSTRPAGAVLRVRALAKDSSGNQAFSDRETRVVSPAAGGAAVLTGRVYDDSTGLPLGGALATLVGSDGNGHAYAATATSDDRGAYFLNAAAGHGTLQIARPGWTRVDRPIDIPGSQALRVFDARLTPLVAAGSTVPSIVGGTVQGGDALLTIASGGLAVDTALGVTPVGQQGLEGLLPPGWSPAGVVDVTPHGVDFTAPQSLSFSNLLKLPVGTNAIVAAWDEAESAWRAVATTSVAGNGSRLTAAIASTGPFAWLVADTVPSAPPLPAAGGLVDGVARAAVPDPATIHITPQPKVLFYKPGVHSIVGAVLSSPLPSGTLLRSRIVESYTFTSTDQARPDPFVEDLVFYQRPGPASTVSAGFVVTPSLTFDPLDLQQGVITVELDVPSDINAKPTVGTEGGTVGTPTGEALQVPANAFPANVPVEIEALTLDTLGIALPPELSFVGGASVAFAGATPAAPIVLSVPRPPQVDGASPIVLLRLTMIEGKTRLLMVGIGRVVGTKVMSDVIVPGAAAILDGVSTSGRYLFVRGTSGLAFATGIVTGSDGHPLARALVSASGLPIVALSDLLGRYVVPVAVGPVTITATNLQNHDTQSVQRTVAAAGTVVSGDVPLSVLSLTMTSLTPVEGATSVALSAAVVATFSAPIDPATLTGPSGPSIVVKTTGGAVVAGAVTLAAGNTRATFRPSSLLPPNESFTATVSTDVKDLAGRPLSAGAVTHFTSLDTTPPVAPAAGSITATIPDANGFTTVTGTQGTAGAHDKVSIVNKTKKTSFPALVAADGGFSATFAAGAGDTLVVAITDPSGNQTVVPMPRFKRTNADGSMASVVGSEGGHLDGPGGTAVDVPAGALPDGTIVTIKAIDEASFPTKLTDEQKQFFTFGGGIGLDFGGAVPSQYVNVSLAPKGGETFLDRWIVGQVVTDGAQSFLNVVDTARLIDDRITTSSKPCPGVQADALFGFLKPTQGSVGVLYGRFSSGDSSGMTSSFSQPMFGAGASGVTLPYVMQSTSESSDVCMPVLAGRVTVQPNSQKLIIPAFVFTPLDRQIVVRNQRLDREFYYPYNVADYRFLVDGKGTDKFKVTFAGNDTPEQPAKFLVLPATTAGFVNIKLDISTLNSHVASVKIQNLTRKTSVVFLQSAAAVNLPVTGGDEDGYEVTIVDANGNRRTTVPDIESPAGAGNLIARAAVATIDPDTEVFLEQLDASDPQNISVIRRNRIPEEDLKDGGFTYTFNGNEATQTFRVEVVYQDGRAPDAIAIPGVVITISEPVTGRVINTMNVLVPPPDEPFNLGRIKGRDVTPPGVKIAPTPLTGFEPGRLLTFTFNEGVDRDSALNGTTVLDDAGHRISGQVRLSNKNKTLTFVPDAPLHLNSGYTLTFTGLRDAAGNKMARTDFRIVTAAPLSTPVSVPVLDVLESLKLVRKTPSPGNTQTLGFGIAGDLGKTHSMVILDITTTTPEVLSTTPIDDGGRVTVVQNVKDMPTHGPIECGGNLGRTAFTGDLAIVTAYSVGAASAIRFYDVTNPRIPCLVGSKLLTVNPARLPPGVRADGAVRSEFAIARTVVALPSDVNWIAYAAIENVGLMMVDVGGNIPSRSETNAGPEPIANGMYVDVVIANGRLLAIERANGTLDVLDGSLALLSSTRLPLNTVRSLAYADGVVFDRNKDGQISQDEVLNLAFVGGVGGVEIVNMTDLTAPEVLGLSGIVTVPLNAEIFGLDFDLEKRRLFAGGIAPPVNGEYTVYVIDLSGPDPFTPSGTEGAQDDRVIWISPPTLYAAGLMSHRAIVFDAERSMALFGKVGGFDAFRLDANLTGTATFTFFRTVSDGHSSHLDYTGGGIQLAIRGAVVELRGESGAVLQTTNTDENGVYSFRAPVGAKVEVVVQAAIGPPGHETTKVIDNTNGRVAPACGPAPAPTTTLYQKTSGKFVMPARKTMDLLAETKWSASTGYTKREGGPFALLDMIYSAQQTITTVDPAATFKFLTVAWSPCNRSTDGNASLGLIGTSFFSGSDNTLYILGRENTDTDEYDAQIVLHEWSHYFQANFSQDTKVGGDHRLKDILDPRNAFSEGSATALAAMILQDPVAVDTSGPNQAGGGAGRNIESDSNDGSGFFSEDAVEELMWDLYDGISSEFDLEPGPSIDDAVELGFKPIYDAMVKLKTSPAFATIDTFLAYVTNPFAADTSTKTWSNIVTLAHHENIDIALADEFEEWTKRSIHTIAKVGPGLVPTDFDVLVGRIYTPVPVDGTPVGTFGADHVFANLPLQTSLLYDSSLAGNRLYGAVFFTFTVTDPGNYEITATPVANKVLDLTVNLHGANSIASGKTVGAANHIVIGQALTPGIYAFAVKAREFNGVAGCTTGCFPPAVAFFSVQVNKVP